MDSLASQSFYLAILFLFFPIHADFLFAVARQHKSIFTPITVSAVFIGLVAIPTAISARRVFFNGQKFRGMRFLYPTFVLIILNLFMSVVVIYSAYKEESNKSLLPTGLSSTIANPNASPCRPAAG